MKIVLPLADYRRRASLARELRVAIAHMRNTANVIEGRCDASQTISPHTREALMHEVDRTRRLADGLAKALEP